MNTSSKLRELEIELLRNPEGVDFRTQVFVDKFVRVFADTFKAIEYLLDRKKINLEESRILSEQIDAIFEELLAAHSDPLFFVDVEKETFELRCKIAKELEKKMIEAKKEELIVSKTTGGE